MSDQAQLLDKIRKLLSLAANNTNEHEAQAAAAKVQDLLTAHNMTMAQVSAAGHDQGPDTGKREKTSSNRSAMYSYQRTLMAALATNNFCMHFIGEQWRRDPRAKERYVTHIGDEQIHDRIRARRVKCHVILGRSVNVQVTLMTYDYLVDTMDRLLPWQGVEKRGKDALLWLEGCAARLVDRLAERRAEAERADRQRAADEKAAAKHPAYAGPTGPGLVVLTDVYGSEEDLNNDFRMGWKPGSTVERRRASEARSVVIQGKIKELEAAGHSYHAAWYMAHGWEVPPEKQESPSERRRREEAEQRRNDRYWDKHYREQAEAANRRAHPSYRQGHRTADEINLDAQVDEQKTPKLK